MLILVIIKLLNRHNFFKCIVTVNVAVIYIQNIQYRGSIFNESINNFTCERTFGVMDCSMAVRTKAENIIEGKAVKVRVSMPLP